MNLEGQAFKSPFQLFKNFITYLSRIFINVGACKGKYLSYLREEFGNASNIQTAQEGPKSKVVLTMPPSPVATC